MSVDLRSQEKIQDERQIDYRYTTTTQDMLLTLEKNNIPTDKLVCIDGTINDVATEEKFELAFIDAEHTDQAAYHDACGCLALLQTDAVLLFHDDWIVYQGIEKFEQYLTQSCKKFRKSKLSNSDVTAITLGDWCDMLDGQISSVSNWDQFRSSSQTRLERKS
jgi:hypothetical protein